MLERKIELVKALFNSSFTINTYLCADGRYSPFGIACKLYQEEFGSLKIEQVGELTTFDKYRTSLPPKVADYFGIYRYIENELYAFCLNNYNSDRIALEFIDKLAVIKRPERKAWYNCYD